VNVFSVGVVSCLLGCLVCACSSSGGGAPAEPPPAGACSVADQGAGTYVEAGWYYCPQSIGGLRDIYLCSNGRLSRVAMCTCTTPTGNPTVCQNRLAGGTYTGVASCEDATSSCYSCTPQVGCR
jgi:hypothetical protein